MLQVARDDRSAVPERGGVPVRKAAVVVLGLVVLVVAGFLLGPRVRVDDRWIEPELPADLDRYLVRSEADVPGIRPGEAKSIEWLDAEAPSVTPLALVYLHGFSADRHEVAPLVSDLARDLGANAYFPRLRGHGRDGAAMGEVTVEDWLEDAAEAVAIGGYIGERVVLMGTSNGGALAVWAATRPEAADRVASLVLISPNLGLQDPAAPLLLWPWGGAMARLVVGPERCFEPKNAEQERHWTTCYPTRALLPLVALMGHVRSLPAGALEVPTLVFYSLGDAIVDPTEIESVMARIAEPPATMHVVEGSSDPEQHVIAGEIMSPETTDGLRREILDFLQPLLTPER